MHKIKKMLSLLLVCIITVMQLSVVASANSETPVSNDDSSGFTIKDISLDDVPSGIEPVEYNSMEEATKYLSEVNKQLKKSASVKNSSERSLLSTKGTCTIAKKSAGLGTIYLKTSYITSGNGNTGSIVSVTPYTQFTGFTLGFGWSQTSIGYWLTNSGKDAYVYCTGTLDYYLLVNGLIKLASTSVSLNGYAYIIR